MALLDNYVSLKIDAYAVGVSAALNTIKDAIVARDGFSLEYSSASGYTFRYQKSAKHPPVFFRIYFSGSAIYCTNIGFSTNGTGTVTRAYATTLSIPIDGSNRLLLVQVAEGFISVLRLSASGWLGVSSDYSYCFDYLFPDNAIFPDSNFVTTAAVAAGSNVVIPLDSSPVGLIPVGSSVFISNSLGYLSYCSVTAVSPSGVTVASLALDMGVGSFVNFGYPFCSHTYSDRCISAYSSFTIGSATPSNFCSRLARMTAPVGSVGSLVVASPVFIYSDLGCPGIVYPNENIIPFVSTRSNSDALPVNNDGSTILGGTASSGTKNSIVDSTKSFATDELVGKALYVFGGTGSGFFSRIISNTSTTIFLEDSCYYVLDSTSVYLFCDRLYLFYCAAASSIPNCAFRV